MSSRQEFLHPTSELTLDPPSPLAVRLVRPKLPPYWPDLPPYWPFLMSPGDLHGTLVRQLVRDHREARGDRAAVMRRGVERLEQAGFVTQWEAGLLRDLVGALQEGPRETVYGIHRRLVDTSERGGVAYTISSITVDSLLNGGADDAAARGIARADAEGAISGAGAGVGLGIWGAVIGAVIGAALMSAAEAIDRGASGV